MGSKLSPLLMLMLIWWGIVAGGEIAQERNVRELLSGSPELTC